MNHSGGVASIPTPGTAAHFHNLGPTSQAAGTLTDQQGNPIDRAIVVSRLKIFDNSPQWRGFGDEALGGKFELKGLREGEEYPVYFLDPKNRLGATATIRRG